MINKEQLAENRITTFATLKATNIPFNIVVDGLYLMNIDNHKILFTVCFDTPEVNICMDGKLHGTFPIKEIPNAIKQLINK